MNKKTVVTGVEMFRKELDSAMAGDNAGILLRGIDKDEIERGMVLAKPGSITPHKILKVKFIFFQKMKVEDILHSLMVTDHNFILEQLMLLVLLLLPEGTEMVMPGDNVKMKVELISEIAMEEGLRFAIREGGRTVGAGVVTKIFE